MKKYKVKILSLTVLFSVILILSIIYMANQNAIYNMETLSKTSKKALKKANIEEQITTKLSEENQVLYLSDVPYIENKSSVQYGKITMNETVDGTPLQLRINGSTVTFKKGVFAHATSRLIYDISEYSQDYDYFITYYGVSAQKGSGGSVRFYIYTSDDETLNADATTNNWKQESTAIDLTTNKTPILRGNTDAIYIKIPIKGKKYLRLDANNVDGNGQDHSLYGDAKFVKEGYNENVTKTVEEYDKEIKELYTGGEITGDLEELLLQREFISKAGAYALKTFVEENPTENKAALDWLLNDVDTLRLFLVGGKPKGTYTKALEILYRMHNTYIEDWNNTNLSQGNVPLKDVYRTMMIASSLEHSGRVYLWINGQVQSNPETRYEIYKELYTNNLIESRIFETLTVEEMRWVINTIIDDEEIKWLNNYTRTVKNGATGPYSYIRYTFGYNYGLDQYYSENNRTKWDEKYNLSKYGVTYGDKSKPKLWIVFEQGAVCGGLSKTGACVWGSYKGLPNTCVSQPGHCAYAMYSRNANGDGVWNLGNDVGGWGPCGNTEQLNSRMMNDWQATEGGWMGSYILIAQAAQNEYEVYEKAQIKLMMARVYSEDKTVQESIYRDVIQEEKVNFGAWESLVNLYLADSSKTEADYYGLAKEITDALTYYPKPMVDLLNKLERKISTPAYVAQFNNTKTKALKAASVANDNNTIQVTAVKQVANYLLGQYDPTIATFSFDGTNANCLVLAPKFKDSELQWEYSLDGGTKWTSTTDHIHPLTDEEIASITAENDIKVNIIGVTRSDESIYVIDITKATKPTNLYNNDLENKVIGANNTIQWKINDTDEWKSYEEATRFTGNTTVKLRVGPTGTKTASDVWTATFTEDNQPKSRTYVNINNLSVYKASSEETSKNGHKEHAIDGNINTIWHSNYAGADSQRYIIIKLAEPKYISALEYVPRQSGSNGRINKYSLSLSMDGEKWTEANEVATGSWANNAETKSVELEESIQAQYVKLQAKTNYGDGRNFITAIMINLFEDLDGARPRAKIDYDITEPTAKPVTAKLNISKGVTVLKTESNPEGKDTITFTDNGEFTFEFEDSEGRKGTATANVYWMKDCDFSFDEKNGVKANTIVLSKKYKPEESTNNLVWEYSLDGGETWSAKQYSLEGELTEEEVKRITTQKDIQVRIVIEESAIGSDEHRIDIQPRGPLPNNMYANDLENRVIGATKEMEWSEKGQDSWTAFDENNETKFIGNREIEVRLSRTGTLQASDSRTFEFTQDEENNKKTYIPIKHLSVNNYSSQSIRPERNEDEQAIYAIDGNINTMWHTSHTSGWHVDGRYIVIELDKPRYISHIQYLAKPNYLYGVMKDGIIEVSSDNETWTKVAEFEGERITESSEITTKNKFIKEIEIETPTYAKYVRITCTESYDYVHGTDRATGNPMDYFVNAAMFNLFEDKTQTATAKNAVITYTPIETTYTPSETTGESSEVIKYITSVKATITSEDGSELTITNNRGKNVYEFTENGEFTFEYVDSNGILGTKKAVVDSIVKVPTATVSYDITETTSGPVKVTIKFSEPVNILNDKFELEKIDETTYACTLEQNIAINLEYESKSSKVKGTPASIFVDWIKKQAPKVTISYSKNKEDGLTNQDVVATISCEEEKITVTNNNGQNTYTFKENGSMTFEYINEDYVTGSITAKVDWIDKVAPVATVTYDITEETTNNVTATLTCNSEEIIITNNEESNKYIFTKNGSFEFTYKDLAGNTNTTTATVNWIKEPEQEEIVIGDIDKDGEITINDLAQLKLHLIDKEILKEESLKAADLDSDGEITINDLAVLKLRLIE